MMGHPHMPRTAWRRSARRWAGVPLWLGILAATAPAWACWVVEWVR